MTQLRAQIQETILPTLVLMSVKTKLIALATPMTVALCLLLTDDARKRVVFHPALFHLPTARIWTANVSLW